MAAPAISSSNITQSLSANGQATAETPRAAAEKPDMVVGQQSRGSRATLVPGEAATQPLARDRHPFEKIIV